MGLVRSLYAVEISLLSLLTAACALPEQTATLVEGPEASAAPAVEPYQGATPQVVKLARFEGYGDPLSGQLWMRMMRPPATTAGEGVAAQSAALGYCAVEEEEWGAVDFDPDTHPSNAFEFYTVPEPGGCEDVDHDGVPDDNPMVCNDGNFGGVAFNAFDPTTCSARVPPGADTRVMSELGGGAPTHDDLFTGADGVGCALQHVGNYTGRNYSRVYMDIDVFNGDSTHQPYGFPYGLGDFNDGSVGTPAPGAARGRPSDLNGLWDLGPMNDGDSVETWIFFRNGDSTNFTFTGYILGEVVEDCGDRDDDDCDGIDDNGCGDVGYGQDCYFDADCRSGSCVGASPDRSLLGAAAVPGSSSLDDDIAGSCEESCGDAFIEGAEECDDIDGTPVPGDGCDASCNVETGYHFPLFGPLTRDYNRDLDQGLRVAAHPSGGWVVAGATEEGGTDADWVLMRVTGSGDVDTGWGTGGFSDLADFDAANLNDRPRCLGVMSDGTVVAGGSTGNSISLAYWDENGVLTDTVFTTVAFAQLIDCLVMADDSILVSGTSYNGADMDIRLLKFLANGMVDNTWAMGTPLASGVGFITVPPAANIVDGETFTIDGTVFELDKDSSVAGGNIQVDISADVTAADVATRMANEINSAGIDELLVAETDGNPVVVLAHLGPGSATASHTMSDPSIVLRQPIGGGVVRDLPLADPHDQGTAITIDGMGNIAMAGVSGAEVWVTRFLASGAVDMMFNMGDTPTFQVLTTTGFPTTIAAFPGAIVVGSNNGSDGYLGHLSGGGMIINEATTTMDLVLDIVVDGAGRAVIAGERIGTGGYVKRSQAGLLALDPTFGVSGLHLATDTFATPGVTLDVGDEIMLVGTTITDDFYLSRIKP